MSKSSRIKHASSAILLSGATSCFATLSPSLIALTGGTAPGSGGATYIGFTNPVLNANGQVAFNANLTGGSSTSGIFTGTSASVQAVALQGTAAPSGGNYSTLYSSSNPATTAVLNSTGQLAFTAPLTGGSATSGVFTGTAGSLQAVALQGTAAPSGGNFNVFQAAAINSSYAPVLNPSGTLALATSLTGGTPSPGAGVFTGTSAGTLQTVAKVGDASPAGGNYFSTVTVPTINSTGQVAFVAGYNSSSTYGLFAGTPGSIQTVMAGGTAAPGTGGELYGIPSTTYSYNNAGQVGFQSPLTGGASSQGVFVGTPGNVQPVALNNTLAPGGTGGTFTSLTNITLNDTGRLAFTSTLTGGTAASGLFVGTPSSVQPVALASTVAPDGATYSSFTSGLVQNGVGQVAFIANLTGSGISAGTNDGALFAGTPGNIFQVLQKGDTVDLGASYGATEFRTIADSAASIGFLINAGGEDGKGIDFNDSGLLALRLSFTDGSSGIFTLPAVAEAVPEPTSLSLLAAGAGMLLGRKRRVGSKLH